jgi:ketosteroid isomerase-like protein
MPRSAELERFAREHLQAYRERDLAHLIGDCTHDILVIGTDESDWIEGRAELEQVLRGEPGTEIEIDDLTAQSEGSLGWIAGHIRYILQDRGTLHARLTAVARRENGQWRLVQSHASIGRPWARRPHGRTKGEAMDEVCLVAPLLSDKAEAARAFMRELDGPRRDDYSASERRIGISKEVWFLAPTPAGELLVGYMESSDFESAFAAFVTSDNEFDLWFKQRFAEVTGIDLNHPPQMRLPEVLSSYDSRISTPTP